MNDKSNRKNVSVDDILDYRASKLSPELRAQLPRDFVHYTPKLYKNLALPSEVHGISLGIEFMKKWFLSKFPKDYFKVVHVNGKHVLDDYSNFNKYNIKREKPMLAIVPTIEYDYDRENLDAYMADPRILLHRSDYQQSFIRDYHFMSFLYMRLRALKMNFNFKVRVSTRAQQLDVWNTMELLFRIGSTQYTRISCDFHIPYEIMANMACMAKFELDEKGKIKDISAFLSYINQHSDLPIIYKMRAINQKPEFFVRVNDLYTHINTVDKLQLDDGNRVGMLDDDFLVEMNCVLTLPVPHFYAFMNQKSLVETIPITNNKNVIALYSINNYEIPEENYKGWGRIVVTNYLCEAGEEFVDLSPIIGDPNLPLNIAIRYNMDHSISPNAFMETRFYYSDDVAKIVKGYMNYKNLHFVFENPIEKEQMIDIIIYADKEYINSIMVQTGNYKDRVKDTGGGLAN